jgi:hypothetical protein
MVIVVLDDQARVMSREATFRERLLSRVRAGALDRALARGAAPEASFLLAVRANELAAPTTRKSLAESFGQLAARPLSSRTRVAGNSLIDWPAVREARSELSEVVARLRGPGPLPAAGLASLRLLLTDGAGPLYYPRRRDALRTALSDALGLLDPTVPW